MNYFKQGSFYYGRRPDGKYIQVATFNGLSNPSISVMSESVAHHTINGNLSEAITLREFKEVFAKAIIDIAMMDVVEMPEIKHDELNESDVQKS